MLCLYCTLRYMASSVVTKITVVCVCVCVRKMQRAYREKCRVILWIHTPPWHNKKQFFCVFNSKSGHTRHRVRLKDNKIAEHASKKVSLLLLFHNNPQILYVIFHIYIINFYAHPMCWSYTNAKNKHIEHAGLPLWNARNKICVWKIMLEVCTATNMARNYMLNAVKATSDSLSWWCPISIKKCHHCKINQMKQQY